MLLVYFLCYMHWCIIFNSDSTTYDVVRGKNLFINVEESFKLPPRVLKQMKAVLNESLCNNVKMKWLNKFIIHYCKLFEYKR